MVNQVIAVDIAGAAMILADPQVCLAPVCESIKAVAEVGLTGAASHVAEGVGTAGKPAQPAVVVGEGRLATVGAIGVTIEISLGAGSIVAGPLIAQDVRCICQLRGAVVVTASTMRRIEQAHTGAVAALAVGAAL